MLYLKGILILLFLLSPPLYPSPFYSAIEKFGNMKPPKYDLAAKQVKETMDKRYAPNWSLSHHIHTVLSLCTYIHHFVCSLSFSLCLRIYPVLCVYANTHTHICKHTLWYIRTHTPARPSAHVCMHARAHTRTQVLHYRRVFRGGCGVREADTSLHVLRWKPCRLAFQEPLLDALILCMDKPSLYTDYIHAIRT